MDGRVFASASIGSRLFVGGDFVAAGGNTNIAFIACWDGTNWTGLAGGLNGSVRALAVSDNDLYVGGDFWEVRQSDGTILTAYRIAKWNGSSWSRLGMGFDSAVNALVFNSGKLCAGGMFMGVIQENGDWTPVSYIAQWSSGVWSAIGGGVNSQVFALATNAGSLYAGGYFSQATQSNGTNVIVNGIARWTGTTWTNLGSGLAGPVAFPYASSLAFVGTDLYVGGDFSSAGGTNANHVARWNGRWFPLGDGGRNGVDYPVGALLGKGNDLYVGGAFTTATSPAGALTVNAVARWNGTQWASLGRGTGGAIYNIGSFRTNIIIGGALYGTTQTDLSRVSFSGIAAWDGAKWLGLGPGEGVESIANAIAVDGSNVYVGGQFQTAGKIRAGGLVVWNGTGWRQIGGGMGGAVNALAISGTNVYAGGTFQQVLQTNSALLTVNRIARWTGKQWSALGQGLDDTVFALGCSGNDLYVGGRFTRAMQAGGGVVDAYLIARWNGAAWSALGSGTGTGAGVNAIAVSGTNVYVGGDFKQIGGVNVTNLARWNGYTWSSFGNDSMPGNYLSVGALLASGNDLYVAGILLKGDGSPSIYTIARWDGAKWFIVGTPSGGTVNAFAQSRGILFATGYFTGISGVSAPGVARWDGASWTPLAGGVTSLGTPAGNALGIQGTSVFVAGSFAKAGNYQAYNFARWTDPGLLPSLQIGQAQNGNIQLRWPIDDAAFLLQHTTQLRTSNNWTAVSKPATTNGSFRIVTLPATNQSEWFRLKN